MHDALFADQARLEDPHLWERARALGLDLERFDADRRCDDVLERVKRGLPRRRARRRGDDADAVRVARGAAPSAWTLAELERRAGAVGP